MRYCDFKFYKEEYEGTLSERSFNRLSLDASAYIKRHTYKRINEQNVPETVKLCTCSLVDKINKLEKRRGKTSESVGTWSVNYQDSSEDSNEMYDVLVNYLSEEKDEKGTYLLYRGC